MTTATVEDQALTEEEITTLRYLLQHSEAKEWVRAVKLQEARTKQRLVEAEERRALPVVITDDAAPAPGSIFNKMSDQELILAISRMKDAAVATGDYRQVSIAESVYNTRKREQQVAGLKASVTALSPTPR